MLASWQAAGERVASAAHTADRYGQAIGRDADAAILTAGSAASVALESSERSKEASDKIIGGIDRFNTAVDSLNTLIQHTDVNLNMNNGILPQLAEALKSINLAVGDADAVVKALNPEQIAAIMQDARIAMININNGTLEGQQMLAHLNISAKEFQDILFDLRHPEKPTKFVRAVSIMLQILRGTSMVGQTAPLFGK